MGRYVSQPLTVSCATIRDVRQFLTGCLYVSDKKLFDKEEYWQPPDEFEKRRKGDCEDFAFWTWRQMFDMGFDVRLVFGRHGRYGTGHAWVEYFENSDCFLVEPLLCRVGDTFPRLNTLRYTPGFRFRGMARPSDISHIKNDHRASPGARWFPSYGNTCSFGPGCMYGSSGVSPGSHGKLSVECSSNATSRGCGSGAN
jgi:hypothetical protein